jgi:hypothetical protein
VLPGAITRRAAAGATVSVIAHPGLAPPEPRYRPSAALADYVRCRDLTCRYPGCTVPATRCDVDHTVPYPFGPTAASNLKCLCREHHLLKTFWSGVLGWRDRQLPDATVHWTTPDGRTHTTRPGALLLFPHLCEPTAPITTHPVPAGHHRGLKMPQRRLTRTRDRAHRVIEEREANRIAIDNETALTAEEIIHDIEDTAAQANSDPPPF